MHLKEVKFTWCINAICERTCHKHLNSEVLTGTCIIQYANPSPWASESPIWRYAHHILCTNFALDEMQQERNRITESRYLRRKFKIYSQETPTDKLAFYNMEKILSYEIFQCHLAGFYITKEWNSTRKENKTTPKMGTACINGLNWATKHGQI